MVDNDFKEKKYKMTYDLICADCKIKKTFSAPTLRGLCDLARAEGWAINRDNKLQWCPHCASNHRNVGRKGNLRSAI